MTTEHDKVNSIKDSDHDPPKKNQEQGRSQDPQQPQLLALTRANLQLKRFWEERFEPNKLMLKGVIRNFVQYRIMFNTDLVEFTLPEEKKTVCEVFSEVNDGRAVILLNTNCGLCHSVFGTSAAFSDNVDEMDECFDKIFDTYCGSLALTFADHANRH